MPNTATAAKDVLSQIRDLQLAIEDFVVQESLPIADNDDTLSHKRNSKTLHPADEKTMVEEGKGSTAVVTTNEKTLVEAGISNHPYTATGYEPLDQISIRFSNDFSSLVNRFTALRDQLNDKSDPSRPFGTTTTSVPRTEETTKQLVESELRPQTITNTPYLVPPYSILSDLPCSSFTTTPCTRKPISSRRPRRPSTQNSKKSRYFTKPVPEKEFTYTPRSYDEMMRIPDPGERIAFYERTFKQCIRANSQLVSWIDRTKAKGVPKPMTEGYRPPPRPPTAMEMTSAAGGGNSTTSFSSGRSDQTQTSISSSISVLLKKASSSSAAATATLGRRVLFHNRTITATPRMAAMGRLFLPPSMSRLSFSRPKFMPSGGDDEGGAGAPPKPPRRHHPIGTPYESVRLPRWRAAPSPITKPRSPTAGTTPSFARIRSYKVRPTPPLQSYASPMPTTTTLVRPPRPARNGSVDTAVLKKTRLSHVVQTEDNTLNEMCNNLPNMDRSELQAYLDEAGGDQMTAITLAMNNWKNKPERTGYHSYISIN